MSSIPQRPPKKQCSCGGLKERIKELEEKLESFEDDIGFLIMTIDLRQDIPEIYDTAVQILNKLREK